MIINNLSVFKLSALACPICGRGVGHVESESGASNLREVTTILIACNGEQTGGTSHRWYMFASDLKADPTPLKMNEADDDRR